MATVRVRGTAETLRAFAAIRVASALAVAEARRTLATDVQENAVRRVAVDTGGLRDSVRVTESGVSAGVGLPDIRAHANEYGTFKMAAQPFLRPAADETDGTPAELRAAAIILAAAR